MMKLHRHYSMQWSQFSIGWLFRTKKFTPSNLESTRLHRCLGLLELTALGTGSMLGAGIYVVAPDAGKFNSGPAMFLSFIIAGIASLFSGLCYAELGARIPKAGSAYAYSYVSVGELWAFVVGWNLILEYVIGTASVARAAVTYIDVLANNILSTTFQKYMPIGLPYLGAYFDPLAFGLTLLLAVLLAIGVRESTTVNNILVLLNVAVSAYIIIVGPFYADSSYWTLTAEQVFNATNSTSFGTGGFMPYGFGGVMTGASAAFYAFIGFDCIATTGEEVAHPERNIPLSIVFSLALCTVCYIGMSIVFTMQSPYYALSSGNLLANVPYGATTVASAALLGVVTNLLGLMFPMPRVIYAMAEDGLLFSFLAKVSPTFKTPLVATLLSGLLTAFFAAIFNVDQLVKMLSIGTLTAYSLVAASVLILRYREHFLDTPPPALSDDANINQSSQLGGDDVPLAFDGEGSHSLLSYFKGIFSLRSYGKQPTKFTAVLGTSLTLIISISVLIMVLFLMVQTVLVPWPTWWPILFMSLFGLLAVAFGFRIWLLPQNINFKTFKVPAVPLTPILALSVNFYLLVSLDVDTWIRFGVWMAIGAVIYVFYGMWASGVRAQAEETSGVNQSDHGHSLYGTLPGETTFESSDQNATSFVK